LQTSTSDAAIDTAFASTSDVVIDITFWSNDIVQR
jgi:hypothetical protein